MQLLAEHEIQSLLVEGGSNVQAQFIATDLVDEIVTYITPLVLGGTALPAVYGQALAEISHYQLLDVKSLNQDVKIRVRRKECLQE